MFFQLNISIPSNLSDRSTIIITNKVHYYQKNFKRKMTGLNLIMHYQISSVTFVLCSW
jgi:hypothetical protein